MTDLETTIKDLHNDIDAIVKDALVKIVNIRHKGEWPVGFGKYIEDLENGMVDGMGDLSAAAQHEAESMGQADVY